MKNTIAAKRTPTARMTRRNRGERKRRRENIDGGKVVGNDPVAMTIAPISIAYLQVIMTKRKAGVDGSDERSGKRKKGEASEEVPVTTILTAIETLAKTTSVRSVR